MTYNPTYFSGSGLTFQSKGKRHHSFRHFQTSDGVVIGMFQGTRGDRPDLDFIIKFLEPGPKRRLRTPQNMHWVVALMIKSETNPDLVKQFIATCITFYRQAKPFQTLADRINYKSRLPELTRGFGALSNKHNYSIEVIALFIELFTICEKATPRPKKMFEGLLDTFAKYCEGRKDYYQVMSATVGGYG